MNCKHPICFHIFFQSISDNFANLLGEMNINWKVISSSFLLPVNVFVSIKDEVMLSLLQFIK